ncbi:glutaminase [Kordiimonas aquimaris]|uniref:glutaminase n=1 Tax=Kordiimonas aquimaris TaxID=707591 RepID=UPI0021D3DDDB|nr:glutaminase [Kordiimonas aquimaris]
MKTDQHKQEDVQDYQAILESIEEAVQPCFGKGRVANYIPALGQVSPNKFGMTVRTARGECFSVGDANEPFSIQSISKLFVLQLVMSQLGDVVWERVGKEPSGDRFNSLMKLELEHGVPRNPFINAGALATLDLLMSLSGDTRERILNYMRYLGLNKTISSNATVVNSELEHAHINRAMIHLMKTYGCIDSDPEELIATYCYQCALEMSCMDLATAGLPLAMDGYSPLHGDTVLSGKQNKRINAVMLTCGMYDSVGSFAYRVGLPAKSGVGGGILAVVPGELSVAVWSPELDKSGNSYVGTAALEMFTSMTHASIF